MDSPRFTPRRRLQARLLLEGQATALPVDLSPHGFQVELPHVPPPGTPLRGTLELSGQTLPFTAEVTWAQAGDPRLSLRGRMSVRFTAIPDSFYALLRASLPD